MSDDGLVKVFNFAHPDLDRIERLPVNTMCAHCEEPIRQDDSGFSMISVDEHGHGSRVYEHRACFLRTVLGSVAHIEERCSCFVPGSTCGDPEGLTRRQAAEAAVLAYEHLQTAPVATGDGPAGTHGKRGWMGSRGPEDLGD